MKGWSNMTKFTKTLKKASNILKQNDVLSQIDVIVNSFNDEIAKDNYLHYTDGETAQRLRCELRCKYLKPKSKTSATYLREAIAKINPQLKDVTIAKVKPIIDDVLLKNMFLYYQQLEVIMVDGCIEVCTTKIAYGITDLFPLDDSITDAIKLFSYNISYKHDEIVARYGTPTQDKTTVKLAIIQELLNTDTTVIKNTLNALTEYISNYLVNMFGAESFYKYDEIHYYQTCTDTMLSKFVGRYYMLPKNSKTEQLDFKGALSPIEANKILLTYVRNAIYYC
jgi:hypothetical protein